MSSQLPPPRPEDWRSAPELPPASPPPSSGWLTPGKALAVGAGVLLLIGALIAGGALLTDDDDRPSSATASTTIAPTTEAATTAPRSDEVTTSAPGVTTLPGTTLPGTLPGGSTAPTTAPSTTPGATAPTTTPSTTPGATAPTTTIAPSSGGPGTVPPTVPPGITVAPTDQATAEALVLAQDLGDALAAGDWEEARRLNPGRNESDAFLDQEYGPLEATTVVLADSRPAGDRVDLRIGLVAHEAAPTGDRTSLLCSYWRVDLGDGTVERVAFTPVRVESGFVAPAARADELRQTCRDVKLG